MEKNEPDDIKGILLGNHGVGKTNLIATFAGYNFDPASASTMANSLYQKIIKIDNKPYEIDLWDTAGQELYKGVTKSFINNSKIIIFVYSIIDRKSFEELDFWINYLKENINGKYVCGIVGNKNDLYLNEKVKEKEGVEYAKNKSYKFRLCSAKTDPERFGIFIEELVKDYLRLNDKDETKGIKINSGSQKNKVKGKLCC